MLLSSISYAPELGVRFVSWNECFGVIWLKNEA